MQQNSLFIFGKFKKLPNVPSSKELSFNKLNDRMQIVVYVDPYPFIGERLALLLFSPWEINWLKKL